MAKLIVASLTAVLTLAVGSAAAASPTLSVTPSGSDSGQCTQAAPCRSFDRAYHVASPGQVVEVSAGTYPSQSIGPDAGKAEASSNVVFRPQHDAPVTVLGELRVGARHVTFENMTMGDWYAGINDNTRSQAQQAGYLTFRDIRSQGFYIGGASNVSVIGGSVGPVNDAGAGAAQVKACYQCSYPVSNILIDGVSFHDVVRTSAGRDAGIHTECLHFWGGVSNVVIRNSRFFNCAIMDVFIEDDHGPAGDVHDILVENNFFDAPGSRAGGASTGSYSLYVAGQGGSLRNVMIRFNSFRSTAIIDSFAGGSSNLSFVGNAGVRASWQCYKGVDFEYNVWDSAKCGASDRRANLSFAGGDSNDLHLLPGSGAIGAVPATIAAPTVDIDGQRRPLRSARDAGADQREPAAIDLKAGIGVARLGGALDAVQSWYGTPRSRGRVKTRSGFVDVASYRVPGGTLSVYSSGGTVVGVRTTSAYYTSTTGFGVGAKWTVPQTYRRSVCAGAWVGGAGNADVYVFTGKSRNVARVGGVLIARHGILPIAACR